MPNKSQDLESGRKTFMQTVPTVDEPAEIDTHRENHLHTPGNGIRNQENFRYLKKKAF